MLVLILGIIMNEYHREMVRLNDLVDLQDESKVETITENNKVWFCFDNGYDIEWSRCNTPQKLIGWIRHLSEKNWFTHDVCNDFILEVNYMYRQLEGKDIFTYKI